MKLSHKISLILVSASLLPAAIAISFSVWSIEASRQQGVLDNVAQRVELSAAHISDQYISARREVELYAQLPVLKSMDAENALDFLKNEIERHQGRYEKFIIGTPEGYFYNTEGGNPQKNYLRTFDDSNPDSPPKNIRKRDYWQATVGENTAQHPLSFISKPMISYTTGARQVVISASIIDEKGLLQGMIGAAIDWASITTLMDSVQTAYFNSFSWQPRLMLLTEDGSYWYHWDESRVVALQRDKQGKLILDKNGQTISHSYTLLDEGINELSHAHQQLQKKIHGQVRFINPTDNQAYYYFYSPIGNTNYNIGLLVEEAELFALSIDIINLVGAVIISIISLTLLIAFWNNHHLSEPLEKLVKHLKVIGQGDYRRELHLRTGDELEDISHTLNNMSDAILTREQEVLTINNDLEERIEKRTKDLEDANKQLEALSLIDQLTGLNNRRAMEKDFNLIHEKFKRDGEIYSVILIDIDFFKDYNDHYGHQAGDKILHDVSQTFSKSLRSYEHAYRYGGEEFIIILPSTDTQQANSISERILKSVRSLNITHEKSPLQQLTISAGVHCANSTNTCWEDVVKAADQALYQSKDDGRDRVTTSHQ